MAAPALVAAVPPLIAAGTSLFGAAKTPKTTETSVQRLMTPEQRFMLRRMTELTSQGLSGIQTPTEAARTARAGTTSDVAVRNAIRVIQNDPSLGGGARERSFQDIVESGIGARVGAVQEIGEQEFEEAKRVGMQLSLQGPITGQISQQPGPRGEAFQSAGSTLGMLISILPALFGGKGSPTGAAPSIPGIPTETPGTFPTPPTSGAGLDMEAILRILRTPRTVPLS